MLNKLLFIQVHSGIGGATTSLFQLAVNLQKSHQYEVEVLITSGDGPLRILLEENGIKVHLLTGLLSYGHGNGARTEFWSFPPFRPITDLRFLPSTIKRYGDFFLKNNFNIIYLNSSILWPAAIAAKRNNLRVVTHVREVWYNGILGIRKRFFINLTEKYSDFIIVLSNYSKSQFIKQAKVNVVYNAVDFTRFDAVSLSKIEVRQKLGLLPNELYIIMMGGALPHKGVHVLLKAASKLIREQSAFKIIVLGQVKPYFEKGNGGIKSILKEFLLSDPGKEFKKSVNRYQLDNYLVTPGSVLNVAEWLKASDILVFPATVDHFGRPIIEAGYLEIPVIASDGESSKELVIKDVNGTLFKTGDAGSLLKNLKLLISNAKLRNKLGIEGKKLALERYSLKSQVEEVERLLNTL